MNMLFADNEDKCSPAALFRRERQVDEYCLFCGLSARDLR